MRISEMNWMQVEKYLQAHDLCILPLGCTEQHCHLSLSTDSILAERISVEAAEPMGIPVFPVVSYGLTPSFVEFPGTVSLSSTLYLSLIKELLEAILGQGFSKVLILNGHGGNAPARAAIAEVLVRYPDARIKWHDWWIGHETWSHVQSIDPDASHASWMENFPWTRLPNISQPSEKKPMIDPAVYRQLSPQALKSYLGDGSFGGLYERPDQEMLAIWQTAVHEVRELLLNWA